MRASHRLLLDPRLQIVRATCRWNSLQLTQVETVRRLLLEPRGGARLLRRLLDPCLQKVRATCCWIIPQLMRLRWVITCGWCMSAVARAMAGGPSLAVGPVQLVPRLLLKVNSAA